MKTDIVIDIETLVEPVAASDIEKYMAEYSPPANYKTPEAILRHREKTEKEALNKILDEKRFSIGGKRMISAALGVVDADKRAVVDIQSWASDDLSVITNGLVEYIDQFSEYRVIGWNHKGFDLPEVTKAFWKTNVRPRRRPAKWDIIDLCDHPFKRCKLKDTAKAFGIDVLGVNGSQVEELYAEGNWAKIQEYNEDDVRITGLLFLAASQVFTF